MRVLNDVEVEPSALTLTAGGCSKLVADSLEQLADVILEPGGEGTCTYSSSICFHNTNRRFNLLRRDTQSSTNTTHSGR